MKYARQAWMVFDSHYDRYCAMCIMAERCNEALTNRDREAWLLIARIMHRVAEAN